MNAVVFEYNNPGIPDDVKVEVDEPY